MNHQYRKNPWRREACHWRGFKPTRHFILGIPALDRALTDTLSLPSRGNVKVQCRMCKCASTKKTRIGDAAFYKWSIHQNKVNNVKRQLATTSNPWTARIGPSGFRIFFRICSIKVLIQFVWAGLWSICMSPSSLCRWWTRKRKLLRCTLQSMILQLSTDSGEMQEDTNDVVRFVDLRRVRVHAVLFNNLPPRVRIMFCTLLLPDRTRRNLEEKFR